MNRFVFLSGVLFAIAFRFPGMISAQDNTLVPQYNLQAGMDLIFTATFELQSEGVFAEESTRVIESRFIVVDVENSGTANLLGISKMVRRTLDGQTIEAPYGNISAYNWQWNPKTGRVTIPSTSEEFGTGWTPMIYFPPLPKDPIPLSERIKTSLPIHINNEQIHTENFFVLAQPHSVEENRFNIAASLLGPIPIQSSPQISMQFLEHEIIYNPSIQLPQHSATAYQLKMQDGSDASYADLRIECSLDQTNRFRDEHLPVIRQEIAKFFDYQQQLKQLKIDQAAELIDLMVDFSENSPMPILRDAAKDLVLMHRYDLRLNQNLQQSLPSWEVSPFTAETLSGEEYKFSPDKEKVRVLLFWSLWWEPAEHALLDLEDLRKTLNPNKIEFIGINLDTNKNSVRHYLDQTGIEMTTLWDKNYPKSGIAFRFGIQQVPVMIVIDKEGVIAARDIPFQELVPLLSDLL